MDLIGPYVPFRSNCVKDLFGPYAVSMAPKQTDPQFKLRLTPEIRDRIGAAAARNGRSLNAEILATLELGLDSDIIEERRVKTLSDLYFAKDELKFAEEKIDKLRQLFTNQVELYTNNLINLKSFIMLILAYENELPENILKVARDMLDLYGGLLEKVTTELREIAGQDQPFRDAPPRRQKVKERDNNRG